MPRVLPILIVAGMAMLSVGCQDKSQTADLRGDSIALRDAQGQRMSLLETSAPVRADAWYADRRDRGPGAYAGYASPKVTYSEVYTYDRLSSHHGRVVDHYHRTRRSVTVQDAIR